MKETQESSEKSDKNGQSEEHDGARSRCLDEIRAGTAKSSLTSNSGDFARSSLSDRSKGLPTIEIEDRNTINSKGVERTSNKVSEEASRDCGDNNLKQAKAIDTLREELIKETNAGNFSGSVILSKDGRIIFADAFGKSDREIGLDTTMDTKFRFASMGKMFTAVAVLQLAQDGKLNLGDPLSKYLPDFPNRDFASKTKISDLLTHTSGAGDIFGKDYDEHHRQLKTIQDYLNFYGEKGEGVHKGLGSFDESKPKPAPGEFHYSNYGYMLLGAVISQVAGKTDAEKSSGRGYYDYLKERIFEPTGMSSTGLEPEESNVTGLSRGYMGREKLSNKDTLPYRGSPAGGGYSTAGDMLRFASALMDHKLLNKDFTENLTRGKVQLDEPGAKYAYGFFDVSKNGVKSIGHSGGAEGMNGVLTIYPESGHIAVVLSNLDPPAANNVGKRIEDLFVRD